MKDYLEKVLRQKIIINNNQKIYSDLPLKYKEQYQIYDVSTNGLKWIAIKPNINIGLINLRKDREKIENEINLNCAIFLDSSTFYIREKMIDEGIPFVIKDKDVYLPFIGVLLSNSNKRSVKPVHLISFLTQKLILIAMYEKWSKVNASEASKRLNVTRMSISRCFDEIEYLNIDIIKVISKTRYITINKDILVLWEEIKPLLRNPVIKTYELVDDVKLKNKAGISALSEYTLYSDNIFPTYFLEKKDISKIKRSKLATINDKVGSIVLEVGYSICLDKNKIQDPFSVFLTLQDQEEKDVRLSISIDEMLKEKTWLKD